ncbi:hypothetical protein [uncultured Shimia sp.]|uniref:hypothetical protein n=1 Tax=uncultured Shimia sp. TaxID=573152 RepID=UPI002608A918|nr:hypothetical protein [uncultured Shimia sp.]
MYALALATLKRNIAFYTVVVVVVVMLEMLMSAAGVVTLVFAGMTMLYTHRMIQLDEVFPWSDPLPTRGKDESRIPLFGYVLRFVAFFLALILVMTGGFMVLNTAGIVDPDAFLAEIEMAMWGIFLTVPAFVLIFGLIGTTLPACAERGDTSLKSALARGRATFGKTALNLVIGPIALSLIGFMILGQLGWLIGSLGDGLLPRTLFRTLATILTILPAMLTATALSMAYLGDKSR